MNSTPAFRDVYEADGVYDQLLLRHYFGGATDPELVTDWMTRHYGQPPSALRIAEFGCGTGRITDVLADYASELVLADYSAAMVAVAARRFPDARTFQADTRDAVTTLIGENRAGSFDLVASFWSLSYPIGEFFETMSPAGIVAHMDPARARESAAEFVRRLVELLAPGGHLLVWLFDSDSPEQRLVTQAWEQVASFPAGGRAYTRWQLLDALHDAERDGLGTLTHTRLGGVAYAPDRAAGREWFFGEHFKHHPQLMTDTALHAAVDAFLDRYQLPDGGSAIPSGVHIIDFHAGRHPFTALPRDRS
ncbi:methyltransferase [Nocardia sp. NPDC002869]|uniref:methyltransferase n=1 Tax=Nocardia sp. NPDC002869 TaxID=3161032 RepID=UPI00398D0177